MTKILLCGLACAVAPYLLARLYPLLHGLTRTLVYLLVAGQILIVPIIVSLDPDVSFGSDVYSLGAGIAIMLILSIELVFVAGSAAGLLAATVYLRRRERAEAHARWQDVHSQLNDPR